MGGGGGGGRPTLGDTSRLEEKAKKELERGERTRRNVFLSFSSDDIDEVNLLRAHAKNEKSDIDFIDRSVRKPFDSEQDEYLKRRIAERINQASKTIVYVSDSSARSEWVDWEIRKSLELGKEVIAVHKGEKPPSRLPKAVKENKIKVVSWSDLPNEL